MHVHRGHCPLPLLLRFWLLLAQFLLAPSAFAQVMAWRVRGRVPLGVESTACFVEAQQRDRAAAAAAGGGRSGTPASESELRLQYGLALVRIVNGIADSSQRGRVAASVASLAASAGAPAPLKSRHAVQQLCGGPCRTTWPWFQRSPLPLRFHCAAGLPRILVDLRHEATHNELPSLAALRCVCAGRGVQPAVSSLCR
jgi:ribosomal biogenesis protein LAS1